MDNKSFYTKQDSHIARHINKLFSLRFEIKYYSSWYFKKKILDISDLFPRIFTQKTQRLVFLQTKSMIFKKKRRKSFIISLFFSFLLHVNKYFLCIRGNYFSLSAPKFSLVYLSSQLSNFHLENSAKLFIILEIFNRKIIESSMNSTII